MLSYKILVCYLYTENFIKNLLYFLTNKLLTKYKLFEPKAITEKLLLSYIKINFYRFFY